MYSIGQKIKIKLPFSKDLKFQGIFTIKEVDLLLTYVMLLELLSAFDFSFILGVVE